MQACDNEAVHCPLDFLDISFNLLDILVGRRTKIFPCGLCFQIYVSTFLDSPSRWLLIPVHNKNLSKFLIGYIHPIHWNCL